MDRCGVIIVSVNIFLLKNLQKIVSNIILDLCANRTSSCLS